MGKIASSVEDGVFDLLEDLTDPGKGMLPDGFNYNDQNYMVNNYKTTSNSGYQTSHNTRPTETGVGSSYSSLSSFQPGSSYQGNHRVADTSPGKKQLLSNIIKETPHHQSPSFFNPKYQNVQPLTHAPNFYQQQQNLWYQQQLLRQQQHELLRHQKQQEQQQQLHSQQYHQSTQNQLHNLQEQQNQLIEYHQQIQNMLEMHQQKMQSQHQGAHNFNLVQRQKDFRPSPRFDIESTKRQFKLPVNMIQGRTSPNHLSKILPKERETNSIENRFPSKKSSGDKNFTKVIFPKINLIKEKFPQH